MKHTIGFYNIENLFDVADDLRTIDDTFTINSPKEWNQKKYTNKLHKIAKAITELGIQTSGKVPVIVGLCEVENKKVLEDLLNLTELKQHHYRIIHFDSPDERGIDTAMIYKENHFLLVSQEAHTVYIEDENGDRDTTRDILQVMGYLEGSPVHIIINHWPSKRDNDINAPKRLKAAEVVKHILKKLYTEEENPNILLMGDFNDEPIGESIQSLGVTADKEAMTTSLLYNPMINLFKKGQGTLSYKGEWSLFDQMMFSKSIVHNHSGLELITTAIFNANFLMEWDGQYKGHPFRTYLGNTYLGGYSDHFPVYTILEKK